MLLSDAACRPLGEVYDELASSDAGLTEAEAAARQLGASVNDPRDPMGRRFFNVLATFAEFEADLLSMRTREGLAVGSRRSTRVSARRALR